MAHKTNTNAKNVVLESNTNNAIVNEVNKPTETKSEPKTQRVLESRGDWERIFAHCTKLVVSVANGEELGKDSRDGFSFAKVAEAPHSRAYAQSLLAGFASKKADKFFPTERFVGSPALPEVALSEQATRIKIALAILTATRLGGKDSRAMLSKAEPKQAKSFCQAVLAAL